MLTLLITLALPSGDRPVSPESIHTSPVVWRLAPSRRAIRWRLRLDDSLSDRIRARVAQLPGAELALAYRNLSRTGDTLFLAADTQFHAASTMKVPIMIELFRKVDAGKLSLDRRLRLENRFASIVDGSPYPLDAGDDSDSSMYQRIGQDVPIRDLLDHMIRRSSNLATNTLVAIVGAPDAEQAMRSLGAMRIRVLRGVEDGKAFRAGLNNTTTARDLAIIMAAIQQNRAASAKSCDAMRQILLGQEFNTQIPAGLPPGTAVAHKTGDITGHLHDAAIVYPRTFPPYVLVVLTRGIPDHHVAEQLTADVSRMVYEHAGAIAQVGQ
jgi:beta-lactamase class A